MDDLFGSLSEQDVADACAYADGTLPDERRAEVEQRVLASPDLTALVARQRRALAATAALADEPVPASLRDAVVRSPSRWGRRRWALGFSAAGVAAAAFVVLLVLSIGGGPRGPSVEAAADLALRPPAGPAPAAVAGTQTLAASVGGVAFPDYPATYGWRATGIRHGEVEGRPATVVTYRKGGARIGYAIVDGEPLPPPPEASSVVRSGVEYLTFDRGGAQVVTWRKAGRTCVLAGPVPSGELVALAGWSGRY